MWLRVGLLLFFLNLLTAPSAFAQTAAQKSGARALAKQGIAAFQEGNYEEALDLFTRAESIYHAPPHQVFMARCHEKLGNLVEAYELFNNVRRESLASDAPAAFVSAQEEAAAELAPLEGRLPHLTISVKGAASDVTVFVNGSPLEPAFVGVARPVNPGKYEIQARGEGSSNETVQIELSEGQSESLELDVAAGSENDGPIAADELESDRAGPQRTPAYVSAGVGLSGVAMGTVFLLQRLAKLKKADDQYGSCLASQSCSDSEIDEIGRFDERAATAGTLSIVGYGVGAVGLGLAVVFWQTSSANDSSTKGRSVGLYATTSEVGVTGHF